ncbi:MAG: hypothetical protein KH899_02020 [Haemophilus pittmaniae]|uniref:hypothetical protein n=1 Tax=Haemophilus pittmaniae TaxID=249188 RepID=UPI0023F1705E|nr:hypothetical protein [Haemophilus pittmaniae]MBS6026370.1 hypothetical protein [Haemophilus pittmaniae]
MSKLTFKSKTEAINFLSSRDDLYEHSNGFSPKGTYYLSHGEYSSPDFKVVRYKDGWGIKKIHYFYDGTFYAPKDGRCALYGDDLVLESALNWY